MCVSKVSIEQKGTSGERENSRKVVSTMATFGDLANK